MRKHRLFLVLTIMMVVCIGQPSLNAEELKKLDGEYVVSSRDGQGPVEFGLIVRGSAAQELYANLPVEEKPDDCTGGTQKSDPKGMFCIKDGSEFVCSVGYVLKTRAITPGPLSC